MKTLNRTLLTLVLFVAVALAWSWISRTGWAASVSTVGVGEDYENAFQPLIKVAAAIMAMVAATQLVSRASRFVRARVSRRFAGRSTSPAGMRSPLGFPPDATR